MPNFRDQLYQVMETVKALPGVDQEPLLQSFFERNPHLLTRGEYLNPKAVISKLPVGNRTTDFAYIHPTSGPHHVYMIEIESSSKQIFTTNDEFMASFNHSLQQVHDWLAWSATNRDYFRQIYNDAACRFEGVDNGGMLFPRGVLVYGRREEILKNPIRQDRWRQKKQSEAYVDIMTFDGLIERNPSAFALDERGQFDPLCFSYGGRTFTEKLV